MRTFPCLLGLALSFLASPAATAAEDVADLILHNGKVVTVDRGFAVRQALAVRGQRLLRVGSDEEVLKTRGKETRVIDLGGKMVLPGLIDSHVHPSSAAMTEFDHPVPDMESIQDVLDYIRARAKVVPEGSWIVVRQVFITRLREQRYPTRAELDEAAPRHPVMYATGPDAALNSLALKLSKIDRDFKVTDGGPGHIEKGPDGEPNGILRSCTRYVPAAPVGREATEADQRQRLLALFRDYNASGLTGIIDRDASPGAIDRYQKLLDGPGLPLRLAISHSVSTSGAVENIQKNIRKVAEHPLCKGGPMLRIVGIKTYLDGGMLTGSAYMRQPWGVSRIYSITDPQYRGLLFISPERLLEIVRTTAECGLQYTAHSVGDGAVHTLLNAYEELERAGVALRKTRPCLTHANFWAKEDIERAARLGVVVDLQPAWLYLDARTLTAQFGQERLRYFQPLRSLFEAGVICGGGSDHMQKIGARRAVNPYDPFLGMWVTLIRQAKWFEGALHPEEALSREQAIRFYTINNARLMFLEDQVGSLEAGKLADFIVVDRDLLSCPVEDVKETRCLRTYVNGRLVYERQ
jgi:predicted amidohydrolase YtcJ